MHELSNKSENNWFLWFSRFLVMGFTLLFLSRLVDLQIIRGAYFRELADENRIRTIPILAPRGLILDRSNNQLVGNKTVEKQVEFSSDSGFEKVEIDSSTDDTSDTIQESERVYLLGSAFGHVSGYLSETTREEVGKVRPECPEKGQRRLSQLIGRTGLEEHFDCMLSGFDGEEIVEVDSMGRKIRTLGRKMPTSGEDLRTNIDIELQEIVSKSMQDVRGAVIANNPKGEVLALYSSPSFDPNAFVNSDRVRLNSYFSDKSLPMFNRAIAGLFHPGSVYKPLVGLAALEEKSIETDFVFNDQGIINVDSAFGSFSYSNWYFTQYGGKEGIISLSRALARSTDTYFYKIGELMGVRKIEEWSKKFDLDKESGIELPGEQLGLVPSPEWKLQTKGENWFLGNTYHLAIGQGDLAVTPISIAKMITAVTNGGYLCDMRLVGQTTCEDLELNENYLAIVFDGMRQACETGGTAFPFFDFRSKVLCKTGTAETLKDDVTHAWFVVAYPDVNPEIILTILVEEGGEGSRNAAPIARKILDEYLN